MANNIDYTQPYVSADEYLQAKGVNLEIELQDDDNQSNKVNRFIKDLTDYIRNELVREYGDNDLNENVTNLKEENTQKAETISTQDKALHSAWFVFGTKKELKEQNILDHGEVL